MSTSPFSVLPWLSGWEYKSIPISASCLRGARPIETTLNSFGWLNSIILTTTDVYGTVRTTPMHKNQSPGVAIFPEFVRGLGFVSQNPAGYLVKYFRPDPLLTWGVFTVFIQAGTDSSPYAAPTRIELSLPDLSSQNSALVSAIATVVELTDMEAFMKSLAELPVNKNADLIQTLKSLVKALEVKAK